MLRVSGVLGLLMLTGAAHADGKGAIRWLVDGEVGLFSDSNLSRAERERDRIADEGALVSAGVVMRLVPSFKTALNLRAFAETEHLATASSLARTSFGGQAIFRGQTRLGFTAPVYQVIATVQQDDYAVDQRDSTVTTLQGLVQRRFNSSITFNAGVEVQQRKSDGTVFDNEQARVFGNIDYAVGEHLSLYGVYSFTSGDTFSSAQLVFCNGTPATDIFGLISAAQALEPDEAFNTDFCGSWIAYKLGATTQSLLFGANYGFNHNLSADISVQQVEVSADGGNQYERTIIRAGLLGRF
ncbi:MAG: hypothetical protein Q8J78_17545 [Moraxellaceae bacterium]|nr:hypothetical protein [Moraxellaceae bacterium]